MPSSPPNTPETVPRTFEKSLTIASLLFLGIAIGGGTLGTTLLGIGPATAFFVSTLLGGGIAIRSFNEHTA